MSTDLFLALDGAVAATGQDAGVPAHYGNPIGEQRALARGGAVAVLARGVVTVTGPDRLGWLDSLTSQRLTGLAPGESAESLLLDPHGHVEHDLRIVDDGETTWIITDAPQGAVLATFLDRMRFMLRVEIEDRSGDFTVVGSAAPLSVRAVEPVVSWRDPWSTVAVGGVSYSAVSHHPGEDHRWFESVLPDASVPALVSAVREGGASLAGTLAAEALRVAAWRPRLGVDTDERSIPHELDWLRSAVHLDKGCYRGQETVAKVHNLGHPPRRLVLLDLDGSDGVLPAAGDPVRAERRGDQVEVGRVTSPVNHHERGPIALAVIKRSVPADATLTVVSDGATIAAAQEVIVPERAGRAAGEIPRLPRIGTPRV